MKALLILTLSLSSLMSYADCMLKIKELKEENFTGLRKFERIVNQKGYQLSQEPTVLYIGVSFDEIYKDNEIKPLLEVKFGNYKTDVTMVERIIYREDKLKKIKKSALLSLAKQMPNCSEL